VVIVAAAVAVLVQFLCYCLTYARSIQETSTTRTTHSSSNIYSNSEFAPTSISQMRLWSLCSETREFLLHIIMRNLPHLNIM
jgi:hypothetical protein